MNLHVNKKEKSWDTTSGYSKEIFYIHKINRGTKAGLLCLYS